MFGPNPQAWLTEHHRAHAALVASLAATRRHAARRHVEPKAIATPAPRLAPATGAELACC